MRGRTFSEDLRAAAVRDADKQAIVTRDRTVTYGELDRLVDGLAARLRDVGVERGDRVAVVLPNSVGAAIAIYGALRAGAAFSPLNPTIKRDKLAHVLKDSGAAAVVCDAGHAEVVRAAMAVAGEVPIVTALDSESRDGAGPPPVSLDLAAVIYTSGSTGDPKGVTLTHGNMTFAADSIIEYLGMDESERVLCVVPLSFDYGLYQLLMTIRVGATLVLEQGFAFPGRVVQLLESERITGLPGVPTVFHVLLGLRGLAERELPHLRYLSNTGAALHAPTIEAIRRTFPGARLFSMYGLTECKRATYLPPDQLDARPTSVGVPIPGTEAWIEDEDGNRLGPGEVGRARHPRRARDAGVLERSGADGATPATGAVALGARACDRGPLPHGRGGVSLLRRPPRRPDQVGRREGRAPRDRGRPPRRAGRERGSRRRRARPTAGAGGACARVGQAGRARSTPPSSASTARSTWRTTRCRGSVTVHDELPRTSNGKIDRTGLAADFMGVGVDPV